MRKVIETCEADLSQPMDGKTLAEVLLAPTRIYVKSILGLMSRLPIKAIAHITGGGLPGNLPRVLPDNTRAVVQSGSWQWPAVFNWLQQQGNIATKEMYRTFNCGVGMVIIVADADKTLALDLLQQAGEKAWELGTIEAHSGEADVKIV